jgi:HSP90 family molecular chaperone
MHAFFFLPQLLSLKLELETRPSFKEYQDKLKHIDDLNDSVTIARLEIANLRSQIDSNLIVIKNLENELQAVKKIQHQKLLHSEAAADKDAQMEKDGKKVDACLQTELWAVDEPVIVVQAQSRETNSQPPPPSTANDDLDNNNSLLVEEELQIINHPAIEQEEELILYKEKYTNLSTEKIRLEQELQQMRQDYDTYKNKSLTNLILYLSPIIAIISYLMFSYLMK